jgi:hypothetical protein
MKKRRFLFVLLVVMVLAAACGDDGSTVGTDGGGDAPGDAPRDGDDGGDIGGSSEETVAVQVLVDGGFVPVEAALRTVPSLTVTAEGTVITPAPVLAIYPGPAYLPMQSAQVDPGAVAELVDLARTLGLLDDDLDFGQPPVADVPNTTVTIVSDGVTYTHVANALDMDFESTDSEDDGISDEARANRAALSEFVAAANALAAGDTMWDPDALAVTVVGPFVPSDELTDPDPLEWPLATPPNTDGDYPCTLVEGDDLATLLTALEGANERTAWVVDGAELALAFRVVVPGQVGCG